MAIKSRLDKLSARPWAIPQVPEPTFEELLHAVETAIGAKIEPRAGESLAMAAARLAGVANSGELLALLGGE